MLNIYIILSSYNDECNGYYYYNIKTKARQWEHPLDAEYKLLVEQARKKHLLCNSGQDLSEDTSQIDSGIRSLHGDVSELMTDVPPISTSAIVASTGTLQKMDSSVLELTGSKFLAPLDKKNSLMHFSTFESTRHKRFEVTNYTAISPIATMPKRTNNVNNLLFFHMPPHYGSYASHFSLIFSRK